MLANLMRKFIYILLTIAPIIFLSCAAHSEVTNSTLAFYVVSQEKIDGGRFIDTLDIPRHGYIAAKPDLAVTNLQEVFNDKSRNIVMEPDKDGKTNWIASSDLPQYLVVKLRPDDVKQFMALTKRSVGRQLVVMLGGKTLTAWKQVATSPEGRFEISFQDQGDLNKTEADLKKLIR
jgi:hypothetical protein